MNNKDKILSELLSGKKSTAELCKALGYVKDKTPQYHIINKDMNTLYSLKLLSKRKGKTGGRPGTFWKIKPDINTLKKIWKDYPGHNSELRDNIRFSDYFLKLLPALVESAVKQAVTIQNPCTSPKKLMGMETNTRQISTYDEARIFLMLPFTPPLIDFILDEGFVFQKPTLEGQGIEYYTIRPYTNRWFEKEVRNPNFDIFDRLKYSEFLDSMEHMAVIESVYLNRYKPISSEDVPEFLLKMKDIFYRLRPFSDLKLDEPMSELLYQYGPDGVSRSLISSRAIAHKVKKT